MHGADPPGEPDYGHTPAMVAEVLERLRPERGGWYLDATVGGGGHAAPLLERSEEARLVGLDRDPDAVEAARRRLAAYGHRARIERADFREAGRVLPHLLGDDRLQGALMDLGVSSHQIDTTARGFSFRSGTPLDMRMGGTTSGRRPAADFLNDAAERELGRVFREYGEEPRWRRVARVIARRRRQRALRTSDDLVEALEEALGRELPPRELARLFQAVRIEVNEELDALDEGLEAIRRLLAPGGRLVVIAYHSLEDRKVKRAFREWSRDCVCPPGLPVCRCRGYALGHRVDDGPVRPGAGEVERNPRVRSARLRSWEKVRDAPETDG